MYTHYGRVRVIPTLKGESTDSPIHLGRIYTILSRPILGRGNDRPCRNSMPLPDDLKEARVIHQSRTTTKVNDHVCVAHPHVGLAEERKCFTY